MQIHFNFHYNFKFLKLSSSFFSESHYYLHIITHYHYYVNNLCEDEGSYERQDTRDTKFAKSGVPLMGFVQSFNKLFSSGSEVFPDHTHNQ